MRVSTILYEDRVSAGLGAEADGEHLWLEPAEFTAATGWKPEPIGLCRGDACIQAQPAWRDAGGRYDLVAFSRHLGQPLAREDGAATWAFGEAAAGTASAGASVMAPDFSLPDLDGKLHALSDYRGRKVFLFSWGSY